MSKHILFLFLTLLFLNIATASLDIKNPKVPNLDLPKTTTTTSTTNYSNVNVNNSQYLQGYPPTQFVYRDDWTTINDYPSPCSAGYHVIGIGDTLSCVADADLSGYVPYQGGNNNLNLSIYTITSSGLFSDDKTGSDNSNSITIKTGNTTDGTSGNINIFGGDSLNNPGGNVLIHAGRRTNGASQGLVAIASGVPFPNDLPFDSSMPYSLYVEKHIEVDGNAWVHGNLSTFGYIQAMNNLGYVSGFQKAQGNTDNTIWTLPNTDGTNGQVLTTNGSAQLYWTTPNPPSTTYYVNSTEITGGTITSTNLSEIFYFDNIPYNISEGTGANPMTFYMNYTNVSSVSQWIVREYYTGTHDIQFEIYDYPTATWQNYYSIAGQSTYVISTIDIYDPQDHIGTGANAGIVQVRLRHVEAGNPSHRLYVDFSWLVQGNNVGGSTNLAGYARYNFDGNNFDGTGNFSTTGYLNATGLLSANTNNSLIFNSTGCTIIRGATSAIHVC